LRVSVTALVSFGVLIAAASFAFPPAAAPAPATFIWGKSGDADTLDVNVSADPQGWEVCAQIFNTLVRTRDGGTEIQPDLATNWTVSPDGLVWTFRLRHGVTFQDGTPWDAAAAKFNLDRWADETNRYHLVAGYDYTYWKRLIAGSFRDAHAIAPDTLRIGLRRPDAALLPDLAMLAFSFNSPAAIKTHGVQNIGRHPVGTGPYHLIEWMRGDHVTLGANPTYFRTGLPRTPRVVMRVIPDNSERFRALEDAGVDAMENPNPGDVQTIPAGSGLKVAYRGGFNTGWLRFNLSDTFFKDVRVRQAITMAIDRRALVRAVFGRFGDADDQHLPRVVWGRASQLPAVPYDPDRARQLLSSAGFGVDFGFDLWYPPVATAYFPQPRAVAAAVANDLGKVGIAVRLMTEDAAAYRRDSTMNKFSLFLAGWNGVDADPDAWLGYPFATYNPDSAYDSYNNPAVFDLITRARATNGLRQRASMYAQAETLIAGDFRDVVLLHANVPLVLRRNVDGLVPQPSSIEYMETVALK
jgi:peptide/nickel transport system substrate-binding protein